MLFFHRRRHVSWCVWYGVLAHLAPILHAQSALMNKNLEHSELSLGSLLRARCWLGWLVVRCSCVMVRLSLSLSLPPLRHWRMTLWNMSLSLSLSLSSPPHLSHSLSPLPPPSYAASLISEHQAVQRCNLVSCQPGQGRRHQKKKGEFSSSSSSIKGYEEKGFPFHCELAGSVSNSSWGWKVVPRVPNQQQQRTLNELSTGLRMQKYCYEAPTGHAISAPSFLFACHLCCLGGSTSLLWWKATTSKTLFYAKKSFFPAPLAHKDTLFS